jgi:hypothetical protein
MGILKMSNQRSGKTYRAASNDNSGRGTMLFFKYAAELLNEEGYADEAFYFEQVVDHLVFGGGLPTDKRAVEKVLGL